MSADYTEVSLLTVLDDALVPLDSLAEILASGGHEGVAAVSAGLLRDARARLQSVARCLEVGCGRRLMLRSVGNVLVLVPCPCVKKQTRRTKDKAASSL